MSTETATKTEKVTPVVSIADIKARVAAGEERFAIGASYGLNKSDTKKLFLDTRLKGIKKGKTKTAATKFIIAEDQPTDGASTSEVAGKEKEW